MSAAGFANQVRLAAALAQQGKVIGGIGEIAAYDPNTRLVKVLLHPAEIITGWIPLGTQWAGAGFGLYIGPGLGDVVSVLYVDGDVNTGFAQLFMSTDVEPPVPVPSGEAWLVHSTSSTLKMTNDGAITLAAAADLNLGAVGNINMTAGADINMGATLIQQNAPVMGMDDAVYTGDVVAAGVSLETHLTSGVTSGSDTSGPPIP